MAEEEGRERRRKEGKKRMRGRRRGRRTKGGFREWEDEGKEEDEG